MTMKSRDFFPLGKAQGLAFCNREAETKWLLDNIHAGKHSLLVAPRRFGKSSLADKAIVASKLPSASLNFNVCTSEHEIANLISLAVSSLISNTKIFGPLEKMVHRIKKYLKYLSPKLVLGPEYAQLEINLAQNINAAVGIEEGLLLLENLLAEKKQDAVILMDEFQMVGVIAKGSGVEAAIRNVAQQTKHLSLIFSGSNRRLLKNMFEDDKRPLYKLCRKIAITRMEKKHYEKHLNTASKLRWNSNLADSVINEILLLSTAHPYYVNYLCDIIWTEYDQLPTVAHVQKAWLFLIEEEQSDINAELGALSLGQKKILKYIANYSNNNLTSLETIQTLGMAASSVSTAVNSLIEKDILEKQDEKYIIINPALKYLIN